MKIKYKKNGNFEVEFNKYFKNVDELKNFITDKNKFINTNVLTNKITKIYDELTKLDYSLKSSALDWFIIKKFSFEYKRPNNINFWLERGFGIKEFNENVGKDLKKLDDKIENKFKFNDFEFNFIGIPTCNICKSDLNLQLSIGRYEIKGCENQMCPTHKNTNITTIKQLAFLPLEKFKSKNKRINVNNKTTKEYWLLKGLSNEESLIRVNEIKVKLKNVNKNSFDFYHLTTDMDDESINKNIRENTIICVEYWLKKGLTIKESKIKISEIQKENSKELYKKKELYPESYSGMNNTQIGYWVNKGYNEEESKLKIKERQRTFTLEKCIKKYGKEGGIKRFNDRQVKWLTNNKRSNFSKISQELFWSVIESNPKIKGDEIYFASYNKGEKNDSKRNYEFRLRLNEGVILPDFFNKTKNKIIEFDGVYYHRNTPENSIREDRRDKMILDGGYEILHINELEYKKDKQKVINKCLEFLNNKQ